MASPFSKLPYNLFTWTSSSSMSNLSAISLLRLFKSTTWSYLAITFDGGTVYQGITNYLDGNDDSGIGYKKSGYSRMENNNEIVRIGRSLITPMYFDGIMDEIRISKVERSSAWVETSYNTMNDPSSFFSVGPEESGP